MAASASRWWSNETVAVVTGSNKGIGFEIVRGFAKQGITTVLTARDRTRGSEASAKLKAQGLQVAFHPLDVASLDSVGTFAGWLEKEFGGLDILVNNAGILIPEFSYENAQKVLDTNFYGVKRVTERLLPLLRPSPVGARIVNVSSTLGALSNFESRELKQKLGDAEQLSEPLVESFAQKYLDDVKKGTWRSNGWARGYRQYSESKLFLNAYVRVLAKSLAGRPEGQKIFVNSICPGYVSTDMTDNTRMASPPEDGADTPIWLSLVPDKVPSGKFFTFRREISF